MTIEITLTRFPVFSDQNVSIFIKYIIYEFARVLATFETLILFQLIVSITNIYKVLRITRNIICK
jgi:hypothetical protein